MTQHTLQPVNAYHPDVIECPYEIEKSLRQSAPVYHDATNNIYLVSSFEHVDYVLTHPDLFSSRFVNKLEGNVDIPPEVAEILGAGLSRSDTLLVADPPLVQQGRY